jgi:hypothetical protein
MQKKVIFRDSDIVEFCTATRDDNEIHEPEFMANLGKRVIVPGMLAFSSVASLASGFLKSKATNITVVFNSLLSSGEFAALEVIPDHEDDPGEIRLSAINHKDTLTAPDRYTGLFCRGTHLPSILTGRRKSLDFSEGQLNAFSRLTGNDDPVSAGFLFAVAYASQALILLIEAPENDVEKEIDDLINRNNKVSPFYQSLEIDIASPFPVIVPGEPLEYLLSFEREKPRRVYLANVKCEQGGRLIYQSRYKLVGIPDSIIYRMAKDIRYH